jgi:hypothetical protein
LSVAAGTRHGQLLLSGWCAAVQGVDYLGLDPSRQLLLFAASSPDVLRDIKLPLAAVQQVGSVQLHSDLQDQHLYVLSRCATGGGGQPTWWIIATMHGCVDAVPGRYVGHRWQGGMWATRGLL